MSFEMHTFGEHPIESIAAPCPPGGTGHTFTLPLRIARTADTPRIVGRLSLRASSSPAAKIQRFGISRQEAETFTLTF